MGRTELIALGFTPHVHRGRSYLAKEGTVLDYYVSPYNEAIMEVCPDGKVLFLFPDAESASIR